MILLTKGDRKSIFIKNEDYVFLTKFGERTSRGGHNRIDYGLTIDTAKR